MTQRFGFYRSIDEIFTKFVRTVRVVASYYDLI